MFEGEHTDRRRGVLYLDWLGDDAKDVVVAAGKEEMRQLTVGGGEGIIKGDPKELRELARVVEVPRAAAAVERAARDSELFPATTSLISPFTSMLG